MTTLPDGRIIPPLTADEPTMLTSRLDLHRATLAVKCAGLDDERTPRTPVEPSPLLNRRIRAGRSLDDTGRLGAEDAAFVGGEEAVSLRWILVHLIEEYARHNGHADLLRERVDGVTGS
ncbi:mycothiol transferase [Streptomyces venezuelae]|uniref:DUF664 domain-containing protein n=1 Tax=Streptomyces venezuelae TaxID=54571 RepID=A0A5P2C370_STRVZ|nr:DUF664 domain-containing protein [Streptomyces venezuelae]QES37122.1 hypothetical protein DEJ48_30260 [Streptomyces venezuelae]